jgi:rhodanese-related sulfurtransferase
MTPQSTALLRRTPAKTVHVAEQIGYRRLAELLKEADTQLVEVLPDKEYTEVHLPGAVNIPLKLLDADTTTGLDRGRPVVVYCWDGL